MREKEAKEMKQRAESKEQRAKSMEQRELGSKKSNTSMLRSEKGLALVTVLVLSLITLAIISALIYMVIQGTRISGAYKRYGTAQEAAMGGSELGADFIRERGELLIPGLVNLPNFCDCGDPDDPTDNVFDGGGGPSCLCDKLCDTTFTYPGGVPTMNWVNCVADDRTLDPVTSPDIQFPLAGYVNPITGITTTYQVSVKIVDTIRGNSDLSGEELGGTPVSSSTSGLISAPPLPYLYRVEINSEDTTGDLEERARLSALYAY